MKICQLRDHQRGVTLIELMITVVILGIITAVAIPSYRSYIQRGAVEEATAGLSSGQVALEQYFLDNRSYVGWTCPSATKYFSFTSTLTATTYTLTARGSGTVSGFVYTLNQADARTTAGAWGSANCWIVRNGDSC